MTRPVSPSSPLRRLCGFALAGLLGAAGMLGCVDHNPGGKVLYVFDGGSKSVLAWNDVSKVFAAAPTAPAADRTITSSLLGGITLAWGGMAVDPNANMIYLVTEAGVVYAIYKANDQNGSISQSTDIISYTLTTSLSNSVFGQVALDASRNILYVQENNSQNGQTRVWTLPNVSQIANQSTFADTNQSFSTNGDTWGAGLAAYPGGKLFGLFGGGSAIYDSFGNASSGPRLRLASSAAFPVGLVGANVLIGGNTGISTPCNFGSLAYDPQNSELYVLSQTTTSTTSLPAPAVQVFGYSQLNNTPFNQAAKRVMKDAQTALPNLRILSHPLDSDWLLGANYTATATGSIQGSGTSSFYLWSAPSAGGAATSISVTSAAGAPAVEVRGLVIAGGSN